jgi:hypothetical protein
VLPEFGVMVPVLVMAPPSDNVPVMLVVPLLVNAPVKVSVPAVSVMAPLLFTAPLTVIEPAVILSAQPLAMDILVTPVAAVLITGCSAADSELLLITTFVVVVGTAAGLQLPAVAQALVAAPAVQVALPEPVVVIVVAGITAVVPAGSAKAAVVLIVLTPLAEPTEPVPVVVHPVPAKLNIVGGGVPEYELLKSALVYDKVMLALTAALEVILAIKFARVSLPSFKTLVADTVPLPSSLIKPAFMLEVTATVVVNSMGLHPATAPFGPTGHW